MEESRDVKYYDVRPFKEFADAAGARIRLIFGQRTNGKTYQIDKLCRDAYIDAGEKFVYVRRWRDDIKRQYMESHFSKLDPTIRFRNGEFKIDDDVIGVVTALSSSEHFKGFVADQTYKTVFFDECFTKYRELPNEFDLWQNVLSTIVRDRTDVNVYLVGNTVKRTSTYFEHYGIDVRKLKKGTMMTFDIKQDDGTILKIAVEYCAKNGDVSRNKNHYFVDTSAGKMISEGDFEGEKHYRMLNGASFRDWDRAFRIPVSIRYNGIDYEFRRFNRTLIVNEGRPARHIVAGFDDRKNDGYEYHSVIPFTTNSNELRYWIAFIIDSIREGQFICNDDAVGDVVTEIIERGSL